MSTFWSPFFNAFLITWNTHQQNTHPVQYFSYLFVSFYNPIHTHFLNSRELGAITYIGSLLFRLLSWTCCNQANWTTFWVKLEFALTCRWFWRVRLSSTHSTKHRSAILWQKLSLWKRNVMLWVEVVLFWVRKLFWDQIMKMWRVMLFLNWRFVECILKHKRGLMSFWMVGSSLRSINVIFQVVDELFENTSQKSTNFKLNNSILQKAEGRNRAILIGKKWCLKCLVVLWLTSLLCVKSRLLCMFPFSKSIE